MKAVNNSLSIFFESLCQSNETRAFYPAGMDSVISNTEPSPKGEPQAPQKHRTSERQEIFDWLAAESRPLAELYECCLRLFFETPMPGKRVLICHAIREIRNRLPHVLERTKGGGRFDYSGAVGKLSAAWVEHGVGVESVTASNVDPKKDGSGEVHVRIPRPLFSLVERLITDHETVSIKKFQAATLLFDGKNQDGTVSSNKRPLIVQWVDVTDWFAGQAHVDDKNNKTDADFNWEEMERKFEVFEQSLLARSRSEKFFEQKGAVDDILGKANRV